jgi:hypothetical protein
MLIFERNLFFTAFSDSEAERHHTAHGGQIPLAAASRKLGDGFGNIRHIVSIASLSLSVISYPSWLPSSRCWQAAWLPLNSEDQRK